MVVDAEHCLSQPLIIPIVPDKGFTPRALEQMMDGVVESRSKDVFIEVEFVEETPKEIQGASFFHQFFHESLSY